jgi:hypothetical protein
VCSERQWSHPQETFQFVEWWQMQAVILH